MEISIIICSRNNEISVELYNNLRETVGVDYELIVIDNSGNDYSIFSAYNEGMIRASCPVLCFMHEDIRLHTQDWGKKVLLHFEKSATGIIGVAGSHYFPRLPVSYWGPGITTCNVIHTVNGNTFDSVSNYTNASESSVKAVVVDGLWFCLRRELTKYIRFDESYYSGFHCYDLDICMQILTLNYEVRIVRDISIEHLSLGDSDKKWIANTFSFYYKWKKILPVSTVSFSGDITGNAIFKSTSEMAITIIHKNAGTSYLFTLFRSYLYNNKLTSRKNWKLFSILLSNTIRYLVAFFIHRMITYMKKPMLGLLPV